MKTTAITRSVLFGEPPQKFAVTFLLGAQTGLIKITGPGRDGPQTVHWLRWQTKFRPGCLAVTEQAIAGFLKLEAAAQLRGEMSPDQIDHVNDELVVAGRVHERRRRVDFHERQLPAGDRSGFQSEVG